MRYSIVLSYAGAGFCGWQRQPSAPSVQECLEDALGKLLGGEVPVIGAGRTDTDVNAIGYVACFDGPEGLAADDFCYKLNAILPRSVVVSCIAPAEPDFHPRFDAVRREYTYFLHRCKDPFVEAFSWQCGYPGLDFEAMNAAAGLLVGTHDFSAFRSQGGPDISPIRTMKDVYVQRSETDPDLVEITVIGESFLYNMVRIMAGSLVYVGQGKMTRGEIETLLTGEGARKEAGKTMPAKGLTLEEVFYEDLRW